MDSELNLYAIILLFAFIQGIFYALIFIRRGFREERLSDLIMACLLVALCCTNLYSMLGFMGIYILGQELWFFPHSTGWLVGPLLYYYLKTQINVKYKLRWTDLKHLIPYCLYFTHHILVFLSGKSGIDWWNINVHSPLGIGIIENIGENISLVVYGVATLRLYARYRRWLPTERSDTDDVLLRWYLHFVTVMIVGIFIAFGFFITTFFTQISYQQDWVLRAIVAFIICYLSFTAYHQTQPKQLIFDDKLFDSRIMEPPIISINQVNEINYLKDEISVIKQDSKLASIEFELWRDRIIAIMEDEKLYLNPEITLSELSDKLNSHNSLISNVINAGFQKNFNDFVNTYRVEAFLQKVKQPKFAKYTLLALAFECGFNSKSTFNRAVKKVTNQMPSEFLKIG